MHRARPADPVAQLIERFGLVEHPEGGWYRRIHQSQQRVAQGGRDRAALTTIVYLLAAGQCSRWHCVTSDEIWHFYRGAPLALHRADPEFSGVDTLRLHADGPDCQPVAIVPANHWQAACSTGAYSLLGCTVGPGFDFADFRMLADDETAAGLLRRRQPDWLEFL
jgi:hypothetical protein